MTVKKKTAVGIIVGIAAIILICVGVTATRGKNKSSENKAIATATDSELLSKVEQENHTNTNTPEATQNATPTITPSETPTETPTETAEPTVNATKQPVADEKPNDSKKVVVIDPGHQLKQNTAQEAMAPGSSKTKNKVTSGTQGDYTRVPEYQVNLEVSLKLKKELEARGIKVIMTRETNEVDISNVERAEVANKAKADAFIRIHCDGAENHSTNGMFTISPTKSNPYCKDIYKDCHALSECVLQGALATTNANSRGIMQTDTMSGINWSKVPVTIIEMGFMSNKKEDEALASAKYQKQLAKGIADGIENFLNRK